MRRLATALGLLLPSLAAAGGDFVPGMITRFEKQGEGYAFLFAGETTLIGYGDCRTFEVRVHPEPIRMARFPWLAQNHPSASETAQAAHVLGHASESRERILFGYMGHGLVRKGASCVFASRGLTIGHDDGRTFVLSWHDPT